MGVYYYITRNTGPFVKEGREITTTEWQAAVAADPDLVLEQPKESRASTGIWAVWRSYPGRYPAWFVLLAGDVEVKGMDEALLAKFRRLASVLRARIFCETGEEVT